MNKLIELEEKEKVCLEEKEKIVLKENEKLKNEDIHLNDEIRAEQMQIMTKTLKKKNALGMFGNMFDLNNDGVIDSKEHEEELKFLESMKEGFNADKN